MSKKNTIRLTESELKSMIVETAKNIISELDYKTYANAAHKALRRGDFARGDRFKQAAIDAFNRDYRYTNGHEEYNMNDLDDWGNDGIINIYADLEPESPQEEDILANPQRYKTGLEFRTYSGNDSEGVVHYFDKIDGRKYQKDRDGIPRSYSDDLKQATIKGNKDLTNFAKGKYKYTKDKGWHLPESIISKAINESFKSIIKEQNDQTWRGVKGTFVTEDGYVEYEGKRIDYDDLEDWLYEEIQEYTHSTGERYIEGDVLFYTDVIDAYVDYME